MALPLSLMQYGMAVGEKCQSVCMFKGCVRLSTSKCVRGVLEPGARVGQMFSVTYLPVSTPVEGWK